MKLSKKIEKYLACFKYKKRDNGEGFMHLIDNPPEELRESVYKAHGDRLPDDWIYDKYHSILESFSQYDINDIDDIDEARAEIVDGLVDVYTHDLTGWLHSHNSNMYYLGEAREEFGQAENGFNLLMMAQYRAIDEIFGEVVDLLNN